MDNGKSIALNLQEHETVIERGLKTFVEVGNALMAIRDSRLYKADYTTFEDYCRERWGMSKRHSNRMIEAANVIDNLGPIGLIPQTESQARPLAKLDPDDQLEAWQRAVETAPNGKVTGKHVERVVAKMVAPLSVGVIVEDRKPKNKMAVHSPAKPQSITRRPMC